MILWSFITNCPGLHVSCRPDMPDLKFSKVQNVVQNYTEHCLVLVFDEISMSWHFWTFILVLIIFPGINKLCKEHHTPQLLWHDVVTPTKIKIVQIMVFPVRPAKHIIKYFHFWTLNWRRLLRIPRTADKTNRWDHQINQPRVLT